MKAVSASNSGEFIWSIVVIEEECTFKEIGFECKKFNFFFVLFSVVIF